MATLKDYLGTIVADINHARSIADIESARMAKQYAEDDILQYYSIPRMKMQDVELTIPVGISEVKKSTPIDYQPIDNNKFYSYTYQSLKDIYKVKSFDSKSSKLISNSAKEKIQNLEENLKTGKNQKEELSIFTRSVAINTNRIVKENSYKKKKINIPKLEVVESFLYEKLQDKIIPFKEQQKIEDTEVIIESDKLRELNPNHIIQIKMKIIEQGMEWHKMEDKDGNIVSKLTIE